MILTTITPYWDRPLTLRRWSSALKEASHPEVAHLLIQVEGERIHMAKEYRPDNLRFFNWSMKSEVKPSIGSLHNTGITLANTEWVMKLDVDAIPNTEFFTKLLPILKQAKQQEWFNCGMFYSTPSAANGLLARRTLDRKVYLEFISNLQAYSTSGYHFPAASNFICRRCDYLKAGGCDSRFQGWGWEDYQQLYMLERLSKKECPLPGIIDITNVTNRCRDEISRPKALELFKRDELLALIHLWHPVSRDASYKTAERQMENRKVLLDYILKARHHEPRRPISDQVNEPGLLTPDSSGQARYHT